MHWFVACLMILTAYLIGAIPFGYLVARWRGVNIFEHGSGNIGATNVGRILGRKFGVFVFGLDFAKGAGPVGLAMLLKPHFTDELWTLGFVEVGAGLAAFLGHLFPIYLRFHGGKGVATGAGVVLMLMPIATLAALFVWLIAACAWRYVSLASILAALVLVVVQLLRPGSWNWSEPRTWFCVIAGGLVVVRHHANIGRLLRGTESQLKETIVMHQVSKSLHVLALGLWFGSAIFFSFVVGFSLFGGFTALGKVDQDERPTWFPRPLLYSTQIEGVNGPEEQGSRAAGFAVGPMFLWYFALQGVCGFIALATALAWVRFGSVHRWRVNLLLCAVLLVLIGWPIERRVSALRDPRNAMTEAALRDPSDAEALAAMKEARSTFFQWHTVSVLLNLATIVFVTGAMALAGNLPSAPAVKEGNPVDTPANNPGQ